MKSPAGGQAGTSEIAAELAKAAGISADQAAKVLSLFHFERLLERTDALREVAADARAGASLNIPRSELGRLAGTRLTLDHLRLGIRTSVPGVSVVA